MVNQQSATYSWSFGDGAAGTGSIVAHTYPASGTYTISLTTTTADSCVDVSTITITLIDSVAHNCNSYFTHLPGNIPNEIHFAGFTVSPYPTSFLFNFGDPVSGANNTSTLQNPIHTYLFPGTYIVTLTTYDSAGCTSVSYAQIVIELMNCDNFISVTGVQGLMVSLEGGLINGITASCLWNLGDGSSASGNFVTHTYAAQGTYNITLTTTTTEGCTSVSNTTVTVVDSVPISCNSYFTANAGNTLNQIHFEAHTNSPYPTTFLWNFGDALSANNTSTLQDPDHIFSAFGTYLVTLTTLDSMNCTSQFVAPVSLSAFGFSSLYGQIFANNQPITACKVQLFDQNPDGTMNMIQEVMPDSVNYYNFNNVASGIYRILAIPLPGTVYAQQFVPTYFGDAFLWENAIPVALGQAANPYNIHLVAFDSISGGDGLINGELTTGGKSMSVGSQEILILDHTNTPVKYLFSLADGSFSFAGLPYGESSVYPVITGITTYPVTVVLSETNKSATVVMKISGQTVAGIFDNKEIDFIENIFPNPADEQISAFVTVQGLIKCSVIDASGKTVFVHNETVPAGGALIALPVSGLKPGLYILIVHDGKGNASGRRFVKN
jgi:PKD repeat protein